MKRTRIRRAVIRQLRRGEAVPDGEPRRYKSGHGYVRLRWLVGTQSYVETYEHRVVNGIVTDAEHVHHDNLVRDDNGTGNLVPLTAEEHNRLHADMRRGRPGPPRPWGQGMYYPYTGKAAKEKAEKAEIKRAARRVRAEEMRRLYVDERLTTTQVAERLGVHHSAVSRELRAIGVQLRGGGKSSRKDTGPKPSTRQVVTARAALCCEKCGVSVKWTARHIHHRRPRAMGGSRRTDTNLPSNLLLLCPPCHGDIESNRSEALEKGWLVRSTHNPADVPLWLAGRGWHHLLPDGGVCPATERRAA